MVQNMKIVLRRGSTLALLVVLTVTSSGCQVGKVNGRCRPNGDWGRDTTHILRCEKGRWQRSITIEQYLNLLASPPTPGAAAPAESAGQRNARLKAADYLRYSAFSRLGLIDQLNYEGFSDADAAYGTDAQGADWSQQAQRKGADYLKYSAFSRSGLIAQLEYEKFSEAEAMFGTDAQAADWNLQAARKAAEYLRSSSFSRQGLIDQLIYEGFTPEEAEYGVSTTGL